MWFRVPQSLPAYVSKTLFQVDRRQNWRPINDFKCPPSLPAHACKTVTQSSSSFHHTTCLSNFRFLLFRHAECLSCYSDVQNGLEVPVTDFKFPTNGNRWVPHLSIKPHTVLKHSFHSSHIFGTLKCRLVVWMADLCIYLFCVFI